ncbi:hypothetical protein A2V71_02230 [Candidatus Berkelbacteria bacterium RBG_13_40_8]|uniref:Glycosyl transferase family 1 domain-containing protein n=1 Tax=Candidatus Berkelbacteria bacterium RBG_13_40_8 TaxID=1797467 RepID=A0A1F5DPX5_9BACT|nr:MAG: hypothetical protein A2V71_02230 [Candidatus Berkelbacteria bacterium RBG_13_40_8]
MAKPILAILTDSIRYDNQHPLKYFKQFQVKHFYNNAPYGDLSKSDLNPPAGGAIKWDNFDALEKKLLNLKPDILQGSEPYASKTALRICLLTMKIARKLSIPYIFPMFENRPVKDRLGVITGSILKKILANYTKNAALIFYLNDGAKRNLLEVSVDPKKLKRELYGIWGVDIGLFRPLTKKVTPQGCCWKGQILFVGRLDEAKGIPYLLDAWNSIKSDFQDIEMVFIGKGELEDKVKGEQIKRVSWMKTQDLPAYFAHALFTVYPSVTLKKWEEQVGTVNLQSLSCGVPVITTKSGAIPEYISDKVGILVPERNSKALAQAMKKLLKNPKLRQKLGDAGRKLALEKYDAAKNIERIEKILLGLL